MFQYRFNPKKRTCEYDFWKCKNYYVEICYYYLWTQAKFHIYLDKFIWFSMLLSFGSKLKQTKSIAIKHVLNLSSYVCLLFVTFHTKPNVSSTRHFIVKKWGSFQNFKVHKFWQAFSVFIFAVPNFSWNK